MRPKSPVAQLGERHVAERAVVAEVGEHVLVAASALLDGAGAGEQHPGLAEEVERDVGERDLLLELRGLAHPAREALEAISASSASIRQ